MCRPSLCITSQGWPGSTKRYTCNAENSYIVSVCRYIVLECQGHCSVQWDRCVQWPSFCRQWQKMLSPPPDFGPSSSGVLPRGTFSVKVNLLSLTPEGHPLNSPFRVTAARPRQQHHIQVKRWQSRPVASPWKYSRCWLREVCQERYVYV